MKLTERSLTDKAVNLPLPAGKTDISSSIT